MEELIKQASSRAELVIKANLKYLEALKEKLLEKETIDAKDVDEILKGSKMPEKAKLY